MKMILVSLALSFLMSCGTAPRPTRSDAQLFTIVSEQPDHQTGILTMTIRVFGPATQTNVRTAAESVIAGRKDQYRQIIVSSYTEEMKESEPPFAISRFEGTTVSHRFNSLAETQKIPTH
jgi:hypothetical protein